MFTIFGGATAFTQWQKDQKVTNPKMKAGDPVYFAASNGEAYPTHAYVSGGDVVADVPNELLTMPKPFTVQLDHYPEPVTIFRVEAADKPFDYVYEDNMNKPNDNVDGGSSGVVFVTGTFDPNGGGDETNIHLIPDKSFEECKALVEAGNYLVFKIDGGDAMGQMYALLCEVVDVMRFTSTTNTGSIVVTLRPDDTTPQCVMTVSNFA